MEVEEFQNQQGPNRNSIRPKIKDWEGPKHYRKGLWKLEKLRKIIRGFLKKWEGKSYGEAYSKFCSTPEYDPSKFISWCTGKELFQSEFNKFYQVGENGEIVEAPKKGPSKSKLRHLIPDPKKIGELEKILRKKNYVEVLEGLEDEVISNIRLSIIEADLGISLKEYFISPSRTKKSYERRDKIRKMKRDKARVLKEEKDKTLRDVLKERKREG